MKKVFPLLACILLLGISCTEQTTELTDEQKATIVDEVDSQQQGIMSTINQLDIDTWSEYWSEDDFISVNSGIEFFDNRSVWVDSVANWWSGLESRSYESLELRITPLAPNLALVTRSSSGINSLKSGEKFNFTHHGTVIWKKEAKCWKIIHLHESVQTNPIEE
ncbi:MAG: nuclear transport factor 2 family protein [Acholeplasmataceae bacterium]|nr:nuclear transport factor 2 family protein [Acholeplasmataceae bacterium]